MLGGRAGGDALAPDPDGAAAASSFANIHKKSPPVLRVLCASGSGCVPSPGTAAGEVWSPRCVPLELRVARVCVMPQPGAAFIGNCAFFLVYSNIISVCFERNGVCRLLSH